MLKNRNGTDNGSDPDDYKYVDDIASQDIGYGQVGISVGCGKNVNNEFRQGGTNGNDCQSGYTRWDSQSPADVCGPVNQQAGAANEDHKTEEEKEIIHLKIVLSFGFWVLGFELVTGYWSLVTLHSN